MASTVVLLGGRRAVIPYTHTHKLDGGSARTPNICGPSMEQQSLVANNFRTKIPHNPQPTKLEEAEIFELQ